ncbi:SAM-dependent methyltransferase [Streptacidiphilus sp. EB129]|uniref:SAM-dependent methyltransferase n=1 Tax=Streptacidiphilus sp. EB129 TaxID=3156262 RepID=UPI0035121842
MGDHSPGLVHEFGAKSGVMMADRANGEGVLDEERPPSRDLRPDIPHSARLYDYYLGGKDNFPADREAAARVVQLLPHVPAGARANRRFLGRAVRFAAVRGIRQFLDIGTGIPAAGNTHEIAQAVAPESRVVYVDNDPIVLAHARALLRGTQQGRTGYIDADFRDPEKILHAPQSLDLLDFSQPMALLSVALLHFIPDSEDPAAILRRYTSQLAPGSVLILSHATGDLMDAEKLAAAATALQAVNTSGVDLTPRTHAEVERLFGDWELVEPGVVPVHEWRPDGHVEDAALPRSQANAYGGVAVRTVRR